MSQLVATEMDAAHPKSAEQVDLSMSAYRILSKNPEMDSGGRSRLVDQLIRGKNAAWGWFAIRLQHLSVGERGKISRMIASAGCGETMLWALSEQGIAPSDRNILRDAIVRLNMPMCAILALEQVPDLSETQKRKLERISIGLNPEE